MDERQPLSLKEAAAYLGLKPKYCYKLVFLGKLAYYKPQGKLYFLKEDLDAYIRRNRRAADYELRDRADAILNERKPRARAVQRVK
jgi:excisionase family DNA binding protein